MNIPPLNSGDEVREHLVSLPSGALKGACRHAVSLRFRHAGWKQNCLLGDEVKPLT